MILVGIAALSLPALLINLSYVVGGDWSWHVLRWSIFYTLLAIFVVGALSWALEMPEE